MANLPTVSELTDSHPLVAGFMAACGREGLSSHQILIKVGQACRQSPEVAPAFQRALGQKLYKRAIGISDVGAALYNGARGTLQLAAGGLGSVQGRISNLPYKATDALGLTEGASAPLEAFTGVADKMRTTGKAMWNQVPQNLQGGGHALASPEHPANRYDSATDDVWKSGKPDLFTAVGQPAQRWGGRAAGAAPIAAGALAAYGAPAAIEAAGARAGAGPVVAGAAKAIGKVRDVSQWAGKKPYLGTGLATAGGLGTGFAQTEALNAGLKAMQGGAPPQANAPGQMPLTPEAEAATGINGEQRAATMAATGPVTGGATMPTLNATRPDLPTSQTPPEPVGTPAPTDPAGAPGTGIAGPPTDPSLTPAPPEAQQQPIGDPSQVISPEKLQQASPEEQVQIESTMENIRQLPEEERQRIATEGLNEQDHAGNVDKIRTEKPEWSLDTVIEAYKGMSDLQKTLLLVGGGLGALSLLNFLTDEDADMGSLIPALLGLGGAAGAAASSGMFGEGAQDMVNGAIDTAKGWMGFSPAASPEQAPKEQGGNPNLPKPVNAVPPQLEQEMQNLPNQAGNQWLTNHMGEGDPHKFDGPDAPVLMTKFISGGPEALGLKDGEQVLQLLQNLSPEAKASISAQIKANPQARMLSGAGSLFGGDRYKRLNDIKQIVGA